MVFHFNFVVFAIYYFRSYAIFYAKLHCESILVNFIAEGTAATFASVTVVVLFFHQINED